MKKLSYIAAAFALPLFAFAQIEATSAGVLVLLMMATLGIGVLSVYFLRANLVAQLDDELRIIAQRIESIAAPGRGPAQSFDGPGLPTGSLIGVVQSDGTAVAAAVVRAPRRCHTGSSPNSRRISVRRSLTPAPGP